VFKVAHVDDDGTFGFQPISGCACRMVQREWVDVKVSITDAFGRHTPELRLVRQH
jgi:hypothetical protein